MSMVFLEPAFLKKIVPTMELFSKYERFGTGEVRRFGKRLQTYSVF